MHVFYRRTGSWPTIDPAAYEVTMSPPVAGARIMPHGLTDRMPGPWMEWRTLELPEDPAVGVAALADALDLSGTVAAPEFRNATLMGDAIALYRAICWMLSWPDTLDISALLQTLPTVDDDARAYIERACTMRAP